MPDNGPFVMYQNNVSKAFKMVYPISVSDLKQIAILTKDLQN